MAYSEAEVVAGGLAHVPVIIVLLLFLRNFTQSQYKKKEESLPQSTTAQTSNNQTKVPIENKIGSLTNSSEAIENGAHIESSTSAIHAKNLLIAEINSIQALPQSQIDKGLKKDSSIKNKLKVQLPIESLNKLIKTNKTTSKLFKAARKVLGTSKYFELGYIAFIALGGTSLFLLNANKAPSRQMEIKASKPIHTIYQSKTIKEIKHKKSISTELLISNDSKLLIDLQQMGVPKTNEINNRGLYLALLNKGNRQSILTSQEKEDITYRRLMLRLTRKDFSYLIPTTQEVEWYEM